MRASSTLIATRSSDNSARPPASPTQRTMSGRTVTNASSSAAIARPNTVGNTRVWIANSPRRDGSPNTASPAGLTVSPANGSNPVTRAFIGRNSCVVRPRHIIPGVLPGTAGPPGLFHSGRAKSEKQIACGRLIKHQGGHRAEGNMKRFAMIGLSVLLVGYGAAPAMAQHDHLAQQVQALQAQVQALQAQLAAVRANPVLALGPYVR